MTKSELIEMIEGEITELQNQLISVEGTRAEIAALLEKKLQSLTLLASMTEA